MDKWSTLLPNSGRQLFELAPVDVVSCVHTCHLSAAISINHLSHSLPDINACKHTFHLHAQQLCNGHQTLPYQLLPHVACRDMVDDQAALTSVGVHHGDMVYVLYHFERNVDPAYKPSPFEQRQFGAHITVNDVIAKQTRIERQEKPTVEGLSIDRSAANVFQQYVQAALAFSIKRGGILYGTGESTWIHRQ